MSDSDAPNGLGSLLTRFDTGTSDDFDGRVSPKSQYENMDGGRDDANPRYHSSAAAQNEHDDSVAPLAGFGVASPATYGPGGWQATVAGRTRTSSSNIVSSIDTGGGPYQGQTNGVGAPRPQRPSVGRTPSHTYAPPRRPSQYALTPGSRHRSSELGRSRLNPDADYRAQKKAYAQRLQQNSTEPPPLMTADDYPPSLGYSSGSETEAESPSTGDYITEGADDQETLLYCGSDQMSPSEEELKIPANRERLEWHSMLSNVLTGDVVKQEKKRLTGGTDQAGDTTIRNDLWLGVRAKTCGRSVPAQKRVIEDQRSKVNPEIEEIVNFEIQGETEVGKPSKEQVEDVVKKIEKLESLYPTRQALEQAHPRAASEAYQGSCSAIIAWHSTTALINTELGVLQGWVGNEELDFLKPRERPSSDGNLTDESSFIDRLLKEDGLKSLQGSEEPGKGSLLAGIEQVITKAKATLVENAGGFLEKHLPPYIEELLTLINFPSRLVQEIIRVRLSYANRVKDPAQQVVIMAEQMIVQFQILLTLAVKIKEAYVVISQPEPGWDLPPCIDENFDNVVLDALKFYFKMLNWKLAANKNTFKEAEILELEWDFSNDMGRHFEGADVEVAEQFSLLTSKSLQRLSSYFERELKRRPNEVAGPEMDRRYKQILDSVRVRQRKLFRFSRLLTQSFENTTEYSINLEPRRWKEICDSLVITGHSLVLPTSGGKDDIYVLASPTLSEKPRDIQALLRTCYRALETPEDPSFPYVLVLRCEQPLDWEGHVQKVDMQLPNFDVKHNKLRLIAGGAQHLLQNAKIAFADYADAELDVVMAQRANLPSVDIQLQKIRKMAFKLSNVIMDSVGIVRKQLEGLECQELIQTCFAFATEFGQRSLTYMDQSRRALNVDNMAKLAIEWVSFICDDCDASERKTFRWAVHALEFAMMMTRGQNILAITDQQYAVLRSKVSGCMSLLISHFDIMGARSTVAAQAEKQRTIDGMGGKFRIDISKLRNDEESSALVRQRVVEQLTELDDNRKQREAERQWLGRVLEDSNEADRSLTYLSASATNVTMRWQQGGFVGGGTFGSVYVAVNLDSGSLMAVKEIRLQDPQLIPHLVGQIKDEMGVLQILDHPNIVQYFGIEVHRDKVYIFMEYCSGGSLAALLEHGRIEEEDYIRAYALQMLEGLAYLHESGVIHRDIKPENILLDHNGIIKYVDFGAAKIIARQSGRTVVPNRTSSASSNINSSNNNANGADGGIRGRQKSMTGTPMYMSPEVIRGTAILGPATPGTPSSSSSSGSGSGSGSPNPGNPTPRAASAVDTWSLGCVVLEMATGRRPWANLDNEWAIMYNIAQGNPPQLPTREQLSAEGLAFLKSCFERDPERRATAAELLGSEWIMRLRDRMGLEGSGAQTPMTPSESVGSGSSGRPSLGLRSDTSLSALALSV